MNTPAPRWRWWKYFFVVGGAGLLALLGGAWYATTNSFQGYVRRRLVAEVERITGGHAQIGSFHIVPFHMQVEVRDITVHGSEAASDLPLAHADHLIAQVKVISLLRTQFGFHSLTLEHPVVHIAVAADGTTNIPVIKALANVSEQRSLEQLFALSIDHLSVQHGELIWADRKIPLDFTVDDTGLQMDYSYLHRRYESHFSIGKVETVFQDCRPFSWTAEMNFSLTPASAEIESLKWSSGRSNFKVSGQIRDYRSPQFEGSYEAHFDLQQAAAITRRHGLSGGTADLKGSGNWSANEFSSSGSLALLSVLWENDQVGLKRAAATSDYAITDQQIKLSKIQGEILGGTFAGDAQIDNWLHSLPYPTEGNASARDFGLKKKNSEMPVIEADRPSVRNAGKEKLPGVERGAVQLRVRGISLAEVATALNRPAHPLGRFRPAGSAAGSIDAAWKGSPKNSEISFAVDVARPEIALGSELPVAARLEGRYGMATDELQLSQFRVSTPASKIQASGTISRSTSLQLSLATSDLEEWRPLLGALGAPTNLPFRVDGNAGFNGVVGGSFLSPTLAGTLVADDFEFNVPATSYTPEKEVHWDSLAASIQVSSHSLIMRGGSLHRGQTSADFEIAATLQNGQFTPGSPYTARVNLHNVDVASTAALAGFDQPVSGIADVSLQIAGTRVNPRVQGHIRASRASAYGESIEAFDADLHIGNGETALNNIRLQHQDANVTGTAAYTPASRRFHLDLTGTNFDLARVRQVHLDRLPVEGRADFVLQGSGTLDSPSINAAVQVHNLIANHELVGNLNLKSVTSNGELRISGTSVLTQGNLLIDGGVQMHGDYMSNITARLDRVDIDPLWRAYLGEQLTGRSAVGGTLVLEGPLRYPEQWTLNGNLSDVGLEIQHVKLHNQGTLRFSYAQQIVHIDPLHMIGEGTDITGDGSIHFAALRELRLSANGKVDLRLLNGFNPDLSASGQMLVQMNVGGTLSEPLPQGTIRIENGTVNYAGLTSGVSEMNGSLGLTRDHVRIDHLGGRTGGGTLDLQGEATRYNQQLNFNLTAIGKDVRLRYPPGVSSTANAELHWSGSPSSSTVTGRVMVNKLAVTPGFDFGMYLQQTRQSVVLAPANSPLYNIKLDVAVQTSPELQMKTAIARLSGDADLRVRGSVARPSVLGRADILEGQATFNGIKFQLERGDITFANPVAIEPQLNMEATTHVRNYDLDVMVTGTPGRLSVNYRSEPPLPKSDIIALLALGRTSEESTQLQEQSGLTEFNEQASAQIINQAINETVSSRLQKLFGASRVKIDPQGLVTETNPTARGPQVTIEQQFANNVSLTYSTNVSQSSQQIIQGEYYFTGSISVVATRDQNGVVSFDVQVRRSRK